MDRGLVAFIGAGLQVVASGIVSRPPTGSIREGYAFVEHLLMFGDSGLDEIVIGSVQSLWSEWRRSGLPRVVAEEHITVLPELLEEYRVAPSTVLASLTAMGVSERDGSLAAHRLTAIIIDNASKDGVFDDTEISRQLCFFFVERLLSLLLAQRALIKDLEVPMQCYFAQFTPDTPDGDIATTQAGPCGRDVLHGWSPGAGNAVEIKAATAN